MDPITGFLINLIIGLILSAASTLLKQAFGGDKKSGGSRGTAQVGGKVPQYFLVGTVAEPGKLEYPNEWGDVDGVPNIYAVDVHSFGDLAISDMVGMFINGTRVSIPKTGAVAQGYPVAIPDDGGVPHFWWKFHDGNQTLADAYLTMAFGSDPDRPWLSDMVGRGVPYLITTARQNETLWTGTPKVLGEFEGIGLYDITKDSTRGGSGPQRWAGVVPTPEEQATWPFSDNSAVITYNIERGIFYEGKKIWGGSATAAQLPYDVWAAAINACNAPISLVGGGTEKQFRAGRRINLNERPADVIKDLLIGSNSRISHASDGTVYILVGVPSEADGAFSDADVLATEPLGSIPFPNLDGIINGAAATYREPAQAWEDKETAPYYRSDLEALDDGRQQVEGLDLGTTFSGTQAQRVLKAVIEEGRRFKTHVVALPPEFAQYRPLQVLAWTSSRFGYVSKLFLITARTRGPFGNVIFGLQEVDPADHNWVPGTHERPLTFAPIKTNRPTPQTVSGFLVAPVPGLVAYDVTWSTPSVSVDVDFVRIAHKRAGAADSDTDWSGVVSKPDLLTGSGRITQGLKRATNYEVQIQYLTRSGRPTVASGWIPVAIADVRIGLSDLTDEVNDSRAWATRSIEQLLADQDATMSQIADGMLGESYERNTLRTEVTARFETTVAAYTLEINAVAGNLGALASRTEVLESTVNNTATGVLATATGLSNISTIVTGQGSAITANANAVIAVEADVNGRFAGGIIAIQAQSAPSGWDAKGTFAVRASTGHSYSFAGLSLLAKGDGTSLIILDANETTVTGTLRSVNGLSYWDMDNGDIVSAGFFSFG